MAIIPKNGMANKLNPNHKYCGLFACQLNPLNLKVNSFIRLTINQHKIPITPYSNHGFCNAVPICNGLYKFIRGNEATNNPMAGTGTPVKKAVVAADVLNRANRSAAKQAIKKAGDMARIDTSMASGF